MLETCDQYLKRCISMQGYTALMRAASSGHEDIAEELLCAGADLTLKNSVSDMPTVFLTLIIRVAWDNTDNAFHFIIGS